MSPLITCPEEIPAGTWAIKHAACRTRFVLTDDVDDLPLDGGGKLLCEECSNDGANGYGFYVVAKPSVADVLPEEVATGWAPVPHALWDHGHRLGLTAHDLLIALAIWRHQCAGRAYPTRELLARETSTSPATVKRAVGRLKRAGLLSVRASRGATGRSLPNEYDLSPLWDALARVVRRLEDSSTAGPSDPRRGVPLTRQVEEAQGEPARAGSVSDSEFSADDDEFLSWAAAA